MADIWILRIDPVSLALPWKLVIRAACRESVVSDSYDLLVRAYDAGSDLRVWIFAAK